MGCHDVHASSCAREEGMHADKLKVHPRKNPGDGGKLAYDSVKLRVVAKATDR
jgi:hypothetical protein